jgi:methanogenic corrinoid protein MtbC1
MPNDEEIEWGTTTVYPIAAVSKLTGVGCHTLRVWERRYGFPTPSRSKSGHRRYDAKQVDELRVIAERARRGESISELIERRRETVGANVSTVSSLVVPNQFHHSHTQLIEHLIEGRSNEAEAEFENLAARLSPVELIKLVFEPVLVETGELWFQGKIGVYQEHYTNAFLLRKIQIFLDRVKSANAAGSRTIVMGTIGGERHEGGMLLASVMLELAGWRTIVLGVDLPASEYHDAIARWRPNALGISFVLSRNINKRFDELSGVRGAPVFVGGRGILNHQKAARSRGLIPLTGPIDSVVKELIATYDRGAWGSASASV